MEIYDVVMKLIGPIYPVGETHTDSERFENLKVLTALVNELVTDIDNIAYRNQDDQRASVKAAVDHCSKFMTDDLGIQ